MGKDVAMALGYSNTRDALSRHVDVEDKGVVNHDTQPNRGGTICSTPAGGTSYLTTYLLQSSTEEGLLRFTVALQKGR